MSTQTLETVTNILLQKLEDRDRIIDLELKNMGHSIKLDIQETMSKAHASLEKKIDDKIREAFLNQKEKISWGMEILRFGIVAAMFILSIKMISA